MLTAASLFLAAYGFLTSWTYLRFYKTIFPDLDSSNQPASLRGDSSETFAFSEFFPAPAKPAVAAVGAAVFDALVAVRVCSPFATGDGYRHQQQQHHQSRGVPGGARAEAERRRALALKALDQRLHAATAHSGRGQQQQQSQTTTTTPPPVVRESTPAPAATGPTVRDQPASAAQTAMTSSPGQMLGETRYEPEGEGEKRAA